MRRCTWVLILLLGCFAGFNPAFAADMLDTLGQHDPKGDAAAADKPATQPSDGSGLTPSLSMADNQALLKTLTAILEVLEQLAKVISEPVQPSTTTDKKDTPKKADKIIAKGTVKVNTYLNIRTSPWGSIIGRFHNGDKVDIVGKSGDWYKINHNGQTAYVHSNYVNTSSQGAEKGPEESGGGTVKPIGGAPNGRLEIERMFGPAGQNQVTTSMPAGPGGKSIKVTCHAKIAAKLKAVFEDIKAQGLSGEIHTFDGCYNNRNKRGGSTKSTHAWGIGVDINASENPMGRSTQTAGQKKLAAVFAKHGFHQLSNDRMHFQYCTGY